MLLKLWKFDTYLQKVHQKVCGFKVITTMANIINGGQYCYFSSLVQYLSNNLEVCRVITDHMEEVETDESKC